MKAIFALVLLMVLAFVYAPAPAAEEGGPDQQTQEKIQKMQQEWADAARDKNTGPLEAMLADDFTHTGPGGQLMTKDDFVGHIKDGTFKIDSLEYQNLKVRVYGDAAVATGKVVLKGNWGGTDVSGDYAFTDTFIKHDGKWRQVAGQVTRIENQ